MNNEKAVNNGFDLNEFDIEDICQIIFTENNDQNSLETSTNNKENTKVLGISHGEPKAEWNPKEQCLKIIEEYQEDEEERDFMETNKINFRKNKEINMNIETWEKDIDDIINKYTPNKNESINKAEKDKNILKETARTSNRNRTRKKVNTMKDFSDSDENGKLNSDESYSPGKIKIDTTSDDNQDQFVRIDDEDDDDHNDEEDEDDVDIENYLLGKKRKSSKQESCTRINEKAKIKIIISSKDEFSSPEKHIQGKRLKKAKDNKEWSLPIDTTCAICLGSITDWANPNTCGHDFCKVCIIEWSSNSSNKCPLCKTEFSEIFIYENNKKQGIPIQKKNYIPRVVPNIEPVEDEDINNNSRNDCYVCGSEENKNWWLICDDCQYNVCHTYCNGLRRVPNKEWYCDECRERQKERKKNTKNIIG